MQDPLKQNIPLALSDWSGLSAPLHEMKMLDRMALHTYIPELGIVIVASHTGRCALINLLRGLLPNGRGLYFWRLEKILPLADQEAEGHRPGTQLIGLATSPIQGKGDLHQKLNPQRWRLMLHYRDHSILTYEIWRRQESKSSIESELL
jgi:hypothetical protein